MQKLSIYLNYSEITDLRNNLSWEISNQLFKCNERNFPFIYSKIQTEEGLKNMENTIVSVMYLNECSIQKSLRRIESELALSN